MSERRKIVLERTFDASAIEVWEMWTTPEGIESWWGPDGFEVEVHEIYPKPGGRMSYSMRAVGTEQVEYMRHAGMPTMTRHTVRYTDVVPHRRLGYTQPVDFVPGVEAYDVDTVVDIEPMAGRIRMRVTLDAMHDEQWTEMAVAGFSNELDNLARVLEHRRQQV